MRARSLCRVADGFTGFAAVYDLLALRALTELQRDGIDVPLQASVSGFDDLVWSSVVMPPITTLRQDLATIAECAVEALGHAIGNGEAAAGSMIAARPDCDGVPMKLVIRQSTGPTMHSVVAAAAHARRMVGENPYPFSSISRVYDAPMDRPVVFLECA